MTSADGGANRTVLVPVSYTHLLYEQATVDGVNKWQQFAHITLPQLMPGIVTSTFLLMSGGLKVYDLPFTMTKGGPGYSTYTVTQSIIQQGIGQSQYGDVHKRQVHMLLDSMEAFNGVRVRPGKTLLCIDEIQEIPDLLTLLKALHEEMPDLHVAVAGSYLGMAQHLSLIHIYSTSSTCARPSR